MRFNLKDFYDDLMSMFIVWLDYGLLGLFNESHKVDKAFTIGLIINDNYNYGSLI